MRKSILVLAPCVWCVWAAFGNQVEFRGFVGQKAATLLDGRVYSRYAREDVMDEAVRAFETHYDDTHKKGHGYWQGEFWGKTMLGHVGALRLTGREDVRQYVIGQVRRLVSGYMHPDGYLGTYADPRFVKGGWNLWGRKYTLWALVEAYETTGEKWILDAAEKTADQLISMLEGLKVSVRETGSFKGMPTASILSPMARLYRHVRKPAYRKFMSDIIADWDRADQAPPNLIANAYSGKPVHEWYPDPLLWAKSYEMMSCYEGLLDCAALAESEADSSGACPLPKARMIEAASRFADLLVAHEKNALGCVGYYDHFTHAAANPNATVEMCDVVYWMRLCHALYRATGDVKHIDRAEEAFLNAFLAGLYTCGRWGAYSVRSHGTRHGTAGMAVGMRHHTCCVDNSPRGFYDVAEHAVVKRGNAIEVNHYMPMTVRRNDGIVVEIDGNYPVEDTVRIAIFLPHPAQVSFRVPGWCEEMTVRLTGGPPDRLAGQRQTRTQGRVLMGLERGLTALSLHFAMPTRVVDRPDVGSPALPPGYACDGKGRDGALFLFELPNRFPEMKGLGRKSRALTVMRGPLVLAKSRVLGLCEKEIFGTIAAVGAKDKAADGRGLQVSAEPIAPSACWGAWNLTFACGEARQVVPACDFASAAPSDDWHNAFSIWFVAPLRDEEDKGVSWNRDSGIK